ncbi:hypothetical protein DERF_004395 [Dermatophagoides farinae]|uniref:Uncharacterized protein n=1 Tax=Dermatophagoides farinae TaxID=6954 RepID=A0A922L5H1_DERFA|nr:hypothetical protein DERF_004395 [Dermatophagoides farinae]
MTLSSVKNLVNFPRRFFGNLITDGHGHCPGTSHIQNRLRFTPKIASFSSLTCLTLILASNVICSSVLPNVRTNRCMISSLDCESQSNRISLPSCSQKRINGFGVISKNRTICTLGFMYWICGMCQK